MMDLIARVVQQLQKRPYYLFLYLDALVDKDPQLVSGFADLQVRSYMRMVFGLKLMPLLRCKCTQSLLHHG